jgi:DhnA family fructose-bisphosphate aldolase class Ia
MLKALLVIFMFILLYITHFSAKCNFITRYCVAMMLNTRMAAELGADFVKVVYPDTPERLKELQDACPVPLLIAGGSKISDEEAGKMAEAAVTAGTAGLVFGRNVFQAEDSAKTLKRFRNIVHGE